MPAMAHAVTTRIIHSNNKYVFEKYQPKVSVSYGVGDPNMSTQVQYQKPTL